jgi:hypothetical protein
MNSEQCLKAAMQALLRGDIAERDRLCDAAEKATQREEMEEKARATAKILTVDFYVHADGRAVETKKMYAAAH